MPENLRELYRSVGDGGLFFSNRTIEKVAILASGGAGVAAYAVSHEPITAVITGATTGALMWVGDSLIVKMLESEIPERIESLLQNTYTLIRKAL